MFIVIAFEKKENASRLRLTWAERALISQPNSIGAPDSAKGFDRFNFWLVLVMGALSALAVSSHYRGDVSFFLGAAATVPVVIGAIRGPHLAMIGVLLLYITPQYGSGNQGPLFHLNLLASVAILSSSWFFHYGSRVGGLRAWPPIVLFLLFTGAFIWGEFYMVMFDNFLICAAIVLFCQASLCNSAQVRQMLLAIVFCGSLICAFSLLEGMQQAALDSGERFAMENYDPNYFSYGGGVGFAVILGVLAERSIRLNWCMKALLVLALLVIVMGLSIQGSRGTATAMAMCLILFLLLRGREYFIGVLTVTMAVGLLVVLTPFGAEWVERFTQVNSMVDGGGRLDIWEVAWGAFCKASFLHQMIGYGYCGSAVIVGQDLGMGLRSTHNMYLSFLLDTGVIGLAIFLYYIAKIIRSLLNTSSLYPRLALILLTFSLVQGLFIETQLACMFWISLVVTHAAVALKFESKTETF